METDRFIVKFKDRASRSSAARAESYGRAAEELDLSLKEVRATALGGRVIEAKMPLDKAESAQLVSELESDPSVEYAEPDHIMYPMATAPNDELYPLQWHYWDENSGIRSPDVWTVSRGAGTVVAVIDTGVTDHPDLEANLLPGIDMISSSTVARDGDGRDGDAQDEGDWYSPYECGANTSGSQSSWHGTHVAGIIAASTGNGFGVAGVAPDSKILPIRALGACGGYTSDVADGIVWAVGGAVAGVAQTRTPARVINLSLGGAAACSSTYQSAIDHANRAGAAVVVAAGNDNVDASTTSPANCGGVVTVAATGRQGQRAAYSNFGEVVDVSAPGGDMALTTASGIASTLNDGATVPASPAYFYSQGTSMAAPHVAGAIGLLLSAEPGLKPAEIEARISDSARPRPCIVGDQRCIPGVLDARALLGVEDSLLELIAGEPTIHGIAGMDRTLTAHPGDWSPEDATFSYQWLRDGGPLGGATGQSYRPTVFDVGSRISVTVTGQKTGYVTTAVTSEATGPVEFFTLVPGIPTIQGTAAYGGMLTAHPGTWEGANWESVAFTYQWNRGGVPISGATGKSYAPTTDDIGTSLSVTVSGTSILVPKPVPVTSQPTSSVAKGTLVSSNPSISGRPAVGQNVVADAGEWTSGTKHTYQWLVDGQRYAGATRRSFVPPADAAGKSLAVEVRGQLEGYSDSVRTSLPSIVQLGDLAAPQPTVHGDPLVGEKLAGIPGDWGSDVSLAYQWLRDGEEIPGANENTYVVGLKDLEKTIQVAVTGNLAGYVDATTTSVPTAAVGLGRLATDVPTVSGEPEVGKVLRAEPGKWSKGTVFGYQWFIDGEPIAKATADTFSILPHHVGGFISVEVTGRLAGYTDDRRLSNPTEPVGFGKLSSSAPTVSGSPRVGFRLMAREGEWTTGTTWSYQWSIDGTPIPGATGKYLTLTAEHVGLRIAVSVTGSLSGYEQITHHSSPSSQVLPGVLATSVPTISGVPAVGGVLSAEEGIWSNGTLYAYEWAAGGVPLQGGTGRTYSPTPEDIGKEITVKVTGRLLGYEETYRISTPTKPVGLGTIAAGRVSIAGNPQVGHQLRVESDSWTPAGVSLNYQWLRDGTPIPGATSGTFLLEPSEANATVSVRVSASAPGYRAEAVTAEYVAVAPGILEGSLPAISGTPKMENILTALSHTWTPGSNLSYQWYRSGSAISGATAASYQLGASDVGTRITVSVTATKPGYLTLMKTSPPTAAIASGTLHGTAPKLSGTPKVGHTITATAGTWTPGSTLRYQWYRSGAAIPGATASSHNLTGSDAGKLMSVRITGSKSGYASLVQASAATIRIAPGSLTASTPKISGSPKSGSTLRVSAGPWTSGTKLRYQWYRSGKAIGRATDSSYRLTSTDRGKRITVRVTGSKTGYTAVSRTSARTDTIR